MGRLRYAEQPYFICLVHMRDKSNGFAGFGKTWNQPLFTLKDILLMVGRDDDAGIGVRTIGEDLADRSRGQLSPEAF